MRLGRSLFHGDPADWDGVICGRSVRILRKLTVILYESLLSLILSQTPAALDQEKELLLWRTG